MKKILVIGATLILLLILTAGASAQTINVPSYIKGLTVISSHFETIAATDSTLLVYYVPVQMYLREMQIFAQTVEDTATFRLSSGPTAFSTTIGTAEVNTAGYTPAYWTPSGPAYHKLTAGTVIRLEAVLQDTLYNVDAHLIFTFEP